MKPETRGKKMGRPVRRPGEPDTRDRILEAAVRLFSENGYESTSIRQITQAVGLSESALYRHFGGKEDLLAEIVALTERMVSQPLPAMEEGASGGPSVFRKLFEAPADAFGENPYALRLSRFFFMECPWNERIREYLKSAMEEKADAEVGRILEEEIGRGSVAPFDAAAVAHIINMLRYQWCYKVSILDYGEAYDPARSKRELDPVIRFFEGLYFRDGAGPRPD